MIRFRQPDGASAAVEIFLDGRYLASIRPVPELQEAKNFVGGAAELDVPAEQIGAYLLGWITGAAAAQGRGDLVVALGFRCSTLYPGLYDPLRGRCPAPDPNSGPAALRAGRSDAPPAACTPPAGYEGGGSDPGADVSSPDSVAGDGAGAAKNPDPGAGPGPGRDTPPGHPFSAEEDTPYRRIQSCYGRTFRPGDRVRYRPFDADARGFLGTVQVPAPALPDGGGWVAVLADADDGPMACHPLDLEPVEEAQCEAGQP